MVEPIENFIYMPHHASCIIDRIHSDSVVGKVASVVEQLHNIVAPIARSVSDYRRDLLPCNFGFSDRWGLEA
jgi:hypothetical protein